MIYVKLIGQLGNQMFIYAAAKAVQKQIGGGEIVFETRSLVHSGFKNSLADYRLDTDIAFCDEGFIKNLGFPQKLVTLFYLKRIEGMSNRQRFEFAKKYCKLFNFFGMIICPDGYIEQKIRRKNIAMIGYFQSETWFTNVKRELRRQFI
ncbi:MAG: hypothetical protein LBQ33_06355, partial [Oscillospiraceae bacterium]|nr:hypothetical protein [Oscillospiraceae bacterium]